MLRLQFKRDKAGLPQFTDDDLRAAAAEIKKSDSGGLARIPYELYEFAEGLLVHKVNELCAARGLNYEDAARLVHRLHPHLLTLHFAEGAAHDLDVEIEEQRR